MKANIDQSVREIAIGNSRSVKVFESLGIDYCCGGKRSLQEACQRANVPLEEVLHRLSAVDERPAESGEDWMKADISDLLGHIVQKHHGYIRSESPRLVSLLQKVQIRHGVAHPELKSIQELFAAMLEELLMHMLKEDNVLFPYLAKMEAAASEGRALPAPTFGSVEIPISRMLADHDDAAELLARIRTLSGDFQPPEGACPTYCALYHGLEEFERDLHRHVHLENNIVFPRALEMERKESAYFRS